MKIKWKKSTIGKFTGMPGFDSILKETKKYNNQ